MMRLLVAKLKDIPIKRKLMFLLMLSCTVTLLGSSLLYVGSDLMNIRSEEIQDLESLSQILNNPLSAALAFKDQNAAQEALSGFSSKPSIIAVYVFDAEGALFSRYRILGSKSEKLPLEMVSGSSPAELRAGVEQIKNESHRLLSIPTYFSFVHDITLDQQKVGTIVVHSSVVRVYKNLVRLLLISFLIVSVAFLVAYLLSARLHKLISDPVLSLVDLMHEVSRSKNFSLRAEKAGKDEVGMLVDGFNEMLGEIEERNKILAQRQAHLQQLAHYDSLTLLPNRVLFYDRLSQALHLADREKEVVAVLFLDLDQFKDVNDTLGHRIGDLLLKDVAQRLNTVVRDCDTVARLGGDEFTFFAQRVKNEKNACIVAGKVQELFEAPFRLEGKDIFVTASIGITLYPFDGATVDELLMNADVAMYHAKANGKNTYALYRKNMNANAAERMVMLSDLRLALERKELVLYYQPKVDLVAGMVTSVEALVRWRHPAKGLIAPNQFIPVAEESGLIVPLTEWALIDACMQAKKWNKGRRNSMRVAVNLSPYHFKRQNVIEAVQHALQQTGLDPSLLEVELTESSLMQNDYTIESLVQLKRLGIHITVDDFGTGYSSLSYLHRFPIDSLKIDRSFVWNMTRSDQDLALVTAIIAMAHSLKIGVVAEGVETEEQLNYLCRNGCTHIQGYLISKPLPPEDLTGIINDEQLGNLMPGR